MRENTNKIIKNLIYIPTDEGLNVLVFNFSLAQ